MVDPVPTDEYMTDLRDRGMLICRCQFPIPELIVWAGAWQCMACGGPLPQSHPSVRIPA